MKIIKPLFLLLPLLLASCGKHIVVNYPSDGQNTGRLVIQPTRHLSATYLTVNNQLLVENEAVKKITVQGIPEGMHEFHLTCDNSTFKEKLDASTKFTIKENQTNTQLIEVPPRSNGYWVYSGLSTAGSWVALILLLELEDK